MKVDVIGGGPAGLYFAILMKKDRPDADITVFERNRPDDTFGFGVVFSDETLAAFEAYDRESYREIVDNFAYWDDIEIHFKGTVRRIGGNGFCGCSRVTLLRLLQERARALGVALRFETVVDASLAAHTDADLIVAADGINSAIREVRRDHFGTKIDLRPNKFAWMGSTRAFDAFTFFFRETEHGIGENDGENSQRFVRHVRAAFVRPHHERNRGRGKQQQHQRALQLREKAPPARHRRRGRQLVAAVALEAGARLGRRQPMSRVACEPRQHFVRAQRVRIFRAHGVHSCPPARCPFDLRQDAGRGPARPLAGGRLT